MNEHDPPKRNERALVKSAPKTNKVNGAYQFPYFLQPLGNGSNGEVKKRSRDPFHQQHERFCVRCRKIVNNDLLGGHDGHPWSGRLWCLDCADDSARMLAGMEGSRR
jgi:hypothetical protein